MSKFWKFILVFIVLLLICLFVFSKHSSAPAQPLAQSETSAAIPIAPLLTDNASTTYTDMQLSYPKSSATELPDIFNLVQGVKSDFIQNYANPTPDEISQLNLMENFPYELYVTTKVATSTQSVSYIISVYEFTGGAHGETDEYTFTYDASGKLLTLDDLFTGNYLPTLSQLASTYFTNSLGEYSQPDMIQSGTEATSTNFSAWYLTDSTVTFIFQQYQVGPGVLGVEEFPIDKNTISNILNPMFMLK